MNTKLLKKVLASTLALSMVLPIGVVNADKQNTQQEKSQQTTRISGKDRITTSVEISKSAYTTSENVVLASGFNFADALSAGQLASALDAPLLLSSQNKLDSQTKSEIQRLKAKKVYVVGGDNAISKNGIDTTLKSENIDVTRLEGQDRYSTSQKVMEKTKEIINPEYLLIASGKNFPDALAATSFFVNHKSVMVLSDGLTYPQSNLQEIAIGGKNQLPLKGFTGRRVSGKDRYETALEIAKLSFDKNNNAILASGQVFADSLSAVSLTKKHSAPIILTQSDSLTENAKKYLNGKNVFIVGGEKTVVNDILTRKKLETIDVQKQFEERNKEVDEKLKKERKEFEETFEREKAKQELEMLKTSLDSSKESLDELKSRLHRYQNPDKNNKNTEDEIKEIQHRIEKFDEEFKEFKASQNSIIEEVDKAIPQIDRRVKEGAFGFFEWAGENYPDYKADADNAIAILNEYSKKGDVKKIPGDATSYENLMASADLYKQLKDLIYKANAGNYSTNFSTLAKAMVSCNRYVYSSNKNTFNVTEHLYAGSGNPIEYWYYDGKAVYDEVINIIKEKYTKDREYVAMEKAKEDYKRIHGKEPDYGNFNEILEYSLDVVAVARNSSQVGSNNTFCLNGEKINNFGTKIWQLDRIIKEYKRITSKQELLQEKSKAEGYLKQINDFKKARQKEIDFLKNQKADGISRLKEEIKETEKEVARLEKEYQEKKEAYDKLK